MMAPDWDLERAARDWRVWESEFYVFHVEPPLRDHADLQVVLAAADERYRRICGLLGRAPSSVKARERLTKTNYWIYAPTIVEISRAPEHGRVAAGTVDATGIHFAQLNMSWRDLVDQMIHEETHAIWGREVGEAPSLLNEGVAVFAELRLSARSHERRGEIPEAWDRVILDGRSSFPELCRNPSFWDAYSRGEPVYAVGAALVCYLVHAHGLGVLKEVFEDSHYDDVRLAAAIERRTGLGIEEVEAGVGTLIQTSTGDVT